MEELLKNELEFERVLIHELGHFISTLIVFEEIGEYKPHSIEIKWDSSANQYIGQHKHKNNEKILLGINHSKIQEFHNIITTLYGCVFQALYNDDFNEFEKCKNCLDGKDDNSQVQKVYNDYSHYYKRNDAELLINNHLKLLFEKKISTILQDFDFTNFKVSKYNLGNHYFYDFDFLSKHKEIIKIKSAIRDNFIQIYQQLKGL